ncbi:hypothetical protein H257_04146 [Aphanomyces astaci]|uniref:PDZ domain-containing protein n=2 Tax=Aphanomyces astaci TaxID=112090 RepID=W4GUQ2_APHAT|nr:hypothetical protein H257_04146 [Aphanomyces astaci]ETV83417.1 hypothetical protein H257_04146 [Aphanomyces astaci]|eukprot:XP_009826847.1 hypothetical protein H257_04146 [Aphanomyces astaci]
MSEDMNQRMEQVKQRLQRMTSGNENQNMSNVHRSQAVSSHTSPMRRTSPSTHNRQPPQHQYMQPAIPPQPQQSSMTKPRSSRLPQHPTMQDQGRLNSQQPGPYGQPPTRIPTQRQQHTSQHPPMTRQPQPNDVPSTQELHMRLQQQRAQFESLGATAPRRDALPVQSPSPSIPRQHERSGDPPSHHRRDQLQPPPPRPRDGARGTVPQSHTSSSTSSAFSEYSEPFPLRTSHHHPQPPQQLPMPSDDDRQSAPSVISDLSQNIDDEFNHKLMPPIRQNEYDFLWEGGALGLVLVEDASVHMPVVKRVSTHVSTAAKYVAEGDILVYINANRTRDFNMPALMGMLKDLKKPICMRFRRARDLPEGNTPTLPPLERNEYEFLWEQGSLGMTLGVTAHKATPYVKRLTGKGISPHLALVVPGDELVMINENVCGDLGFEAAMDFIKAVPKPAVLRFRHAVSPTGAATPPEAAASHFETKLMALDEANMYCVQWSDGPFGLTVKELATESGPVPVVTRKTGRNTCAGLRRVAVGDVLVEIGSMKVTDLGFENATKVLRNIAKPVALKFQAVGD